MGAKFGVPMREKHRRVTLESRVLRRVRRREMDRSCRKERNDELHCLYSLQNIVRMIKSRSMKLRDIWINRTNWTGLFEDRVQWRAFVNTVMKLTVS
jgi:hypothetical protein